MDDNKYFSPLTGNPAHEPERPENGSFPEDGESHPLEAEQRGPTSLADFVESPPSYAPLPYAQNTAQAQFYTQQAPRTAQLPLWEQQQAPQTLPQPPRRKKGKGGMKALVALVAVCLVVCIAAATVFVPRLMRQEGENPPTDINAPTLSLKDPPPAEKPQSVTPGAALSAEEVAEIIRPAIVGVVVYSRRGNSQIAGEGSGIIMDEDKTGTYTYIITCAHVISGSGVKVFAQLENGKQYEAEIIGADTRTDLGVLRIKEKGLPKAEFGNSDALKVGSTVYAVGNPGGVKYFGSFTNGIVSAISRNVSSENGYPMECVQHNAAINPGNSGGALVNAYGQVVGINSMKIMGEGFEYEGMGFAIPITPARDIINKLVANGYVPDRPILGITYYPVSASPQYSVVVQANKLPAGALIINDINPLSSLAGTEARRYDMIIAVDGKNMDTPDVLLKKIETGKVGDTMTLTLCRVNTNYEINKFEVKAKLIEDKGGSEPQQTEPEVMNPFS